ncbi:unnamed protein product, partial [Chrysoparadoxa australica]
ECARVFPIISGDGCKATGAGSYVGGRDAHSGGKSHLVAQELPSDVRLRFRLLAHELAGALTKQLRLEVDSSHQIFSMGDTSYLVGTTLASLLQEEKNSQPMSAGTSPGQIGSSWFGRDGLSDACVLLIDRTSDLATPVSHHRNILHRLLCCLPRTGTASGATTFGNSSSSGGISSHLNRGNEDCLHQAHLHDVGIFMPGILGGMGAPAIDAPWSSAQKAIAGLASLGPPPPSLCHPPGTAAAKLVCDMSRLPEDEARILLVDALTQAIKDSGCTFPAPKKRGMGSEVMALVNCLRKGNSSGGGFSPNGVQLFYRYRGLLQVAMAVIEVMQRTAPQSDSRWSNWEDLCMAERVQMQCIRDGVGTVELVQQAIDMLDGAPQVEAGDHCSDSRPAVRDALLLMTRGLALSCRQHQHNRTDQLGPQAIELLSDAISKRLGSMEEANYLLGKLEQANSARSTLQDSVLTGLEHVATAASAKTAATGTGTGETGSGPGDQDGWDDWEEEDDNYATQESGYSCETLIGRVVSMIMQGEEAHCKDINQVKPVSMASVGLGLLSALTGIKKTAKTSLHDCSTLVIFVIGGFCCKELEEVSKVLALHKQGSHGKISTSIKCHCSAASASMGHWGINCSLSLPSGVKRCILGGTTLVTPDIIFEQVFQ